MDYEKINSNKHLIGKAIDSLDQCRFKRGCLLYALRGTLNTEFYLRNEQLMKSDFNESQFFTHVNALIKFIIIDTKKKNEHDVGEDVKHLKAEIESRDKMLVSWSHLNDRCKNFLNQIIKEELKFNKD